MACVAWTPLHLLLNLLQYPSCAVVPRRTRRRAPAIWADAISVESLISSLVSSLALWSLGVAVHRACVSLSRLSRTTVAVRRSRGALADCVR